MAKRKREPKHQTYTEEIFFPCAGCYETGQQRSLFFEQITDEIEAILDNLMYVKKES